MKIKEGSGKMNNEEKLYELMTKMYGEMQKGFQEVNERFEDVNKRFEAVNERIDNVETSLRAEIQEVKNTVVRIEVEHGQKLSALFDVYKQNSDKLDRIEAEVSKHEEIILRRVR